MREITWTWGPAVSAWTSSFVSCCNIWTCCENPPSPHYSQSGCLCSCPSSSEKATSIGFDAYSSGCPCPQSDCADGVVADWGTYSGHGTSCLQSCWDWPSFRLIWRCSSCACQTRCCGGCFWPSARPFEIERATSPNPPRCSIITREIPHGWRRSGTSYRLELVSGMAKLPSSQRTGNSCHTCCCCPPDWLSSVVNSRWWWWRCACLLICSVLSTAHRVHIGSIVGGCACRLALSDSRW